MKSANGSEDWRVLCEMASKEMDSEKLLELAAKINCALDEHNQRSKHRKIKIETVIQPRTSTAAGESEYSYSGASQPGLTAEHHC